MIYKTSTEKNVFFCKTKYMVTHKPYSMKHLSNERHFTSSPSTSYFNLFLHSSLFLLIFRNTVIIYRPD